MKTPTLILLFFTLLFSGNQVKAQTEYSFQEALTQKLISCDYSGNELSTHYIRPLKIVITNLKKKLITVKIPAGLRFVSEPVDFQDLVLVQSSTVILDGNGKKTILLYSMCTEPSKSAPANATNYSLEGMAGEANPNEEMTKLAEFVDKNKFYGLPETQDAVWLIATKDTITDLSYIMGTHNKGMTALKIQTFLAELKGLQIPVKAKAVERSYTVTDNAQQVVQPTKAILKEISGSCKYQLGITSHVRLAMFTKEGILIREIYDEPESRRGEHSLSFSFDATVYTDDLYLFKLIVDEEVMISLRLQVR